MITNFQLFEKKWIPKNPNWFYLVLRAKNNDVWDSLMRGEFIQLKGISDHIGICKHWFDIRDILIVMDGSEVRKLNDIEPIEYYNPDSFCKNNFEFWRRVVTNSPFFSQRNDGSFKTDISFSGAITKIFQDVSYKNLKKKGDGYITTDYYDENNVIKYMKDPSVYSYLSDRYDDLYQIGQLHINNYNDFVQKTLEFLKDYSKNSTLSKDYPWDKNWTIPTEDYITNKLNFNELKKYLVIPFNYISKVFETEGEWVVSGKSFKIPKGSILYFKQLGGKRINRYDSGGLDKERIEEMVKKYGLDHIYQIKTVDNHVEMMNILKNEYNNE